MKTILFTIAFFSTTALATSGGANGPKLPGSKTGLDCKTSLSTSGGASGPKLPEETSGGRDKPDLPKGKGRCK